MQQRSYCTISGVLFGLVALAHLLRLVLRMSIEVNGFPVPMFVSWLGFLVPAMLAAWAFRVRVSPQ